MVRNGRAPNGTQRWLCRDCKVSTRWRNDTQARDLSRLLDFISGKLTQADLPGGGRTFRRKCQPLWNIWPISIPSGEIHRVIHIDGIYLRRVAVVLIAQSPSNEVIAWHVARSETSRAYRELLSKIPSPQLVIADGGSGFASACKDIWPATRIQRCTFHVQSQIIRYTTRNTKTPAGTQLHALAIKLGKVRTPTQRNQWIQDYYTWNRRWKAFLNEMTTLPNGAHVHTHLRLVKARNLINRLIKGGTLFTYLDPTLYEHGEKIGSLPSTNNRIEGGINTQLRTMLKHHRGMSINHQLRAIGWWLHMHTAQPLTPAQLLRLMPTDTDITRQYEAIATRLYKDTKHETYNVQWHELHTTDPYKNNY